MASSFFDIFEKPTVSFYIQQDANALAGFIHYKTFFQDNHCTSPSSLLSWRRVKPYFTSYSLCSNS